MVVINTPPTAPIVISPNGGELWNDSHTVEWESALDYYDYDSTNPTGLDTIGTSSMYQSAQMFTVGLTSEVLKTVEFYVSTVTTSGPIPVSIFATDSVSPVGNALETTDITITGLGKYTVNFNYSLSPNTTYAIVFGLPNTTTTAINIGIWPDNIDPNGNRTTRTGTGAWVNSTTSDLGIKIGTTKGLRHQIQLSLDNGVNWSEIISLTSAGVTSHVYDFINTMETSVAKIRIRAFDGSAYGPWDESDGVFTIQHNIAPTIPTNLTPNGIIIDRLKTQRLTWQHNDSPNDIQSKVDLQWRVQGTGTWNDITSNGPDQEYFISSSIFPNGQIEWRVRTYDGTGIVSPWSNVAVFTSAEPTNAPTIVYPTSPVNVPRPVVEWTSASQSSYQIVVEDSLNAVVWDTGEITSTVKARTVGIDLLNGGTYKIKVRVKDGSGLFSSYTDKTVTVSYTPPAQPTLEAFKGVSSINLSISHSTPSDTQPNVTHNDVYKLIDDVWVRIASGINQTYSDHMVASDVVYQYRVVTFGDNDTSTISDVATQSITLSGTWLHVENNPESLHQFRFVELGRNDNRAHDYSKRKYAGRNKPVVVFSEYEERDIQLTFTLLKRDTDWDALQAIYYARQPIVYRDGRGRMLIGIIGKLPAVDTFYGNSVSVTFEEVDYREGV